MNEQAPSHGSEPLAQELFAEFLERLESGEAVALDQLCALHPSHAEALRAMHEQWVAMSQAFAVLSSDLVDDAVTDSSEEVDGLMAHLRAAVGRSGRYEFGPEVARGAMGRIVQAWDRELRREVALKIQRADRCDPRLQRRFLEEAQIAGQLDHPGIVPIHELGLDEAGRPFFAMRLVRGQPLDELVRSAREGRDGWTRTRALAVVLRVCDAIAYAHQRGVVHRDLKPQNVMVGRFGETYVMDWGLARAEGEGGDSVDSLRASIEVEDLRSPLLTQVGEVVGTPSYMAPEQAEAAASPASRLGDVYAIGAILYHVCAGHAPYAAAGRAPSVVEALARLRDGPPPALPAEIPVELRAIVEHAMARDPEDRYPDVVELADDLRAFLELRVVRAYATGRFQELRKWVARNRALSAVTCALVCLLLAATVVSTTAWLDADRSRKALDGTARRLGVELDRSEFRNARLLLGTDDAPLAEAALWRQHLAGGMPRATRWALFDAYERSPCIAAVDGLAGPEAAVRYLPGGAEVVVGNPDGSVLVVDAVRLTLSRTLARLGSRVHDLVPTPDGRLLLLGTADGRLTVLDLATGAVVRSVQAHDRDLRALALAPDGRGLVTGGGDGRVLAWANPSAEAVEIARHAAPVWCAKFDDSGQHFASGDERGALRLTSREGGEQRSWHLGDRNLMSAAFAADGAQLWVGSADQNLYVVDPARADAVRRVPSRNGTVRAVVRDVDGSMIVGGWWRIDRLTGGGVEVEPLAARQAWKLDLDPRTRRLVATDGDGVLRVFEPRLVDRRTFAGMNLGLSGDGRHVAVDRGGGIQVHSLETSGRAPLAPPILDGGWLALDETGAALAVMGSASPQVRVYDVATGAVRFTAPGPEFAGSNESFAFSPGGQELAVVTGRSAVVRRDAAGGAIRGEYSVGASHVVRVRYVDEGAALLILGVRPAICRIIGLGDGATEDIPVAGTPSVAAVTADGRWLAVADSSGLVSLIDRHTLARREIGRPSGTVWSLAFLPDDPGLLICSTRADGVTFWDIESGEVCYRWRVGDGPITQVQVSADGRTLAGYTMAGIVVRDLHHFERHVAGNLPRELERLRPAGVAPSLRERALRGWAASVLESPWPRWPR